MSASLRRLNLAVHLTLSIGWLGAVAAFLALAVAGVIHDDARVLRSACVGMGLIASYVILPLALGSFLSGLVSGLGTKWGLFRHYWVLIKLALSAVAILILLKQLDPTAHPCGRRLGGAAGGSGFRRVQAARNDSVRTASAAP